MNIKNYVTKLVIISIACAGTTLPMQNNVLTKESSTHDKNLALFKAISDDDEEAVKKVLELGADVNAQDEDQKSIKEGDYPLHMRIRYKAISFLLSSFETKNQITHILIQSGACVDMRNKSGYSPLLLALVMRSTFVSPDSTSRLDALIETLLVNNANPNLFDPINGYRPLHYAAHFGDAELVKKLLYYGADPNVYHNHKETPLIINIKKGSSRSNYREINTWLLQYGANLEHKDAVGTLPTGLPDDFKVNDRDTLLLRLTDESQIRFPGLAALQFMRSLVKYNFDVPLKVYSHFSKQNKLDTLKKNLEPIKLDDVSIIKEEDLVNVTSYKNFLCRLLLLTRPFMTKNNIENDTFSRLEIQEFFKFIKEKAPLLPETGMLARTICTKRMHENLSEKLAKELFNDVLLITQTDSNKRKETHENNEHLDKKIKL